MSGYGRSYGRSRGGYGRSYEPQAPPAGSLPPAEPIKWEEGCKFSEIEELHPETVKAFEKRGFEKLMPVQANTFHAIYEGHNVVARDLTGSGKTLGFCLPLVEKFRKKGYFERSVGRRRLSAIILAPTRELAVQVTNELKKLKHHEGEYKVITVYGGVPIGDQTR